MTVAVRGLRLDDPTWRRLASVGSLGASALIVLGAYLVFGFDRFGIQGFIEPRAIVRLMLTGFYGWLWLALGSWGMARLTFGDKTPIASVLRLVGHAHLPLLLVALILQFVSVALDVTGLAIWPALFAGLFWMPALLVMAVGAATGLSRRHAFIVVAGPYVVWAAVVGRSLWLQLEHLL